MNFRQFLERTERVKTDVGDVLVHINPSSSEIQGLVKRYVILRGIWEEETNDIFLWDADKSVHWYVGMALGIEGQFGKFYIEEEPVGSILFSKVQQEKRPYNSFDAEAIPAVARLMPRRAA